LFYTVKQMLIEYARVATVEDNVSSIQSSLEQLKLSKTNTIHLNIGKKSKYQKDRASVLSYICRSLKDDDEALVANMILQIKSGNTLIQNIQGLAQSLLMSI
jgi:hypothetical protein